MRSVSPTCPSNEYIIVGSPVISTRARDFLFLLFPCGVPGGWSATRKLADYFRVAVIQELRCVRVLDPIPTKPSCVVSFLDDSGLLTSARTDELRFVNLSSQATIRCASAASGRALSSALFRRVEVPLALK